MLLVIVWILGVISWLGNRYDVRFTPGGWKLTTFANIVKDLKKLLERGLREMF